MKFYSISTFRQSVDELTKKPKEGYTSVVEDICKALQDMPDNILRDTNDRIKMFEEYRVYWVSMKHDYMALLRVYPKRGHKGVTDLEDAEYDRLLVELLQENASHILHQVDISNSLADLSSTASLSED